MISNNVRIAPFIIRPPVDNSLPTKEQILFVLDANERLGQVKYGFKGPAKDDIVGMVPLKNDHRPDGISLTALVLKNNKVVIVSSGGIAGLTQYSQPLDMVRVPRSAQSPAIVQPDLINSQNTGPANVRGVTLQEGMGALNSSVFVKWISADTAHQLVSRVQRKGDTIRVTVGDYRDPNVMGGQVVSQRETEIKLPWNSPAGTKIVVVNKDQKVLFEGVLEGNQV